MARKGENIFKRRDGRWEARYIKGREASGKIRYGFCYGKTYGEAKEKVAMSRVAALIPPSPPVPPGDGRPFGACCLEWLQAEKEKVKPSTYAKYETALRKHILPCLGNRSPGEMGTAAADGLRQELLKKGLAPKTVRDILAVLHEILKYAAKRSPGVFPAVEITYPRIQKKEARVLDMEEQRQLVSYLRTGTDPCRFGILLALLTGLRIGELCALRWRNVSLKNREIHVEATLQRVRDYESPGRKTQVILGSPKSDTSFRTIPLTDGAVRLCGEYDPHCPAAFVLTGTERYMEPRQVQKRLAACTRACGLEGVHFHTIRHTFATRCVEAGFDIKSLSEILGHANTAITLNRYVHSPMAFKRKNMEKLAAMEM